MPYTNGFDASVVIPALTGRLGWLALEEESSSGRYFDDGTFHALVTVDNIKATAQTSDVEEYLAARQKAVIQRCLQGVFSEVEQKEKVSLYNRRSEQEQIITGSGSAVGYKITLPPSYEVAVQINSVELYFDTNRTFNVYLFKEGDAAAVKTQSVTAVANKKTKVSLTDWVLSYGTAKTWYVVYFQSDLATAKAIGEDAAFNTTHCFGAEPFTAPASGTTFERKALTYPAQPYGLNLQVQSFKDFTLQIVDQAYLFDEAMGLQMAQIVMEEEFFSTKDNATQRKIAEAARAAIHLELQGSLPIPDSPHVESLRIRIAKELLKVKQSFYPPKAKAQTVNLC